MAFPILSAIFIILSKKLGVSLLGPYKFISVNLFSSTVKSLIMYFPPGPIYVRVYCRLSFFLNRIDTPLEFDVPELKRQSLFHWDLNKRSDDLVVCVSWRQYMSHFLSFK